MSSQDDTRSRAAGGDSGSPGHRIGGDADGRVGDNGQQRDLYREAGVDVTLGNALAHQYGQLAARTLRPGVQTGIGGFAGGFQLDLQKYPKPLLVSGTDGVGTKLSVAHAVDRHNTIGIDCVAMCVNDILCLGAEPLFFLDYLATGKLDAKTAQGVVAGVAEGCREAGCALIGGETAEMPGMYEPGVYDMAGFAVGVVNADAVVDGSRIQKGDVVLGLASNGVHSNGFSLIRKLVSDAGVLWDASMPGWRGSVADELLRPTRIYVSSILAALDAGLPIKGMAHITGGGLPDNLPRCLPEGLGARLDFDTWERHAVFDWLVRQGGMTLSEAASVWNLGIGFTLVTAPEDAQSVSDFLTDLGESVFAIGRVTEHAGPDDARVKWEASAE